MLWRGRRQSDNIEDDRSDGGGGFGRPGGGFGGGPGQFRIPIGGRAGLARSASSTTGVTSIGRHFSARPVSPPPHGLSRGKRARSSSSTRAPPRAIR